MDRREWTRRLRGAVYGRDGSAVLAAATDPARPAGVLQLLGDGLVVALGQRVDGAGGSAAECAARLRERDWTGDSELAAQLDGVSGAGPMPALRPLAVDLEQLADVLEGDPVTTGGGVDLRTGEVWTSGALEYRDELDDDVAPPDAEDPNRFLWAHGEGSRSGYRDMVEFIDTVAEGDRADRLGIAIQGRGAFRRFRDVLGRWPDELERWFEFSGERKRGRARAWLADAGYRVADH